MDDVIGIGFGAPVSGVWATPGNIADFAAKAEARGYGSLWTFQRLLVPEGSSMDSVYQSVLDPMVTLGYVAAVTTRVRLGVAVVNMPYVSPALLAKQAVTVDVLSAGRHDLGLGLGWLPEEFTATGGTMAGRGGRTAEYINALRHLWDGGGPAFSGDFYHLPAGKVAPRPVQRPGPPILLGGAGPRALARVGKLADGWITASRTDLSKIGTSIAVIREAAEGAGRNPAAIRVICRGVVRAGEPQQSADGGGRLRLSGSFADIRADTQWLAEQGVTEIFYDLNWDPLIGSPDADLAGAQDRANEILEELAPTASGSARPAALAPDPRGQA
jgi:probable F420-dependent oxidoreductase